MAYTRYSYAVARKKECTDSYRLDFIDEILKLHLERHRLEAWYYALDTRHLQQFHKQTTNVLV